jgi:ParB-like nuclease domain
MKAVAMNEVITMDTNTTLANQPEAEAQGGFGGYKVHQTAALFPLLDDAALAALAADIDINGQINPIILAPDGVTIVDGRNRWRACEITKTRVDPVFRTLGKHYTEELLIGYILSQNLHRRDLDAGQRSLIKLHAEEHFATVKAAAKERQRAAGGDNILNHKEKAVVTTSSQPVERGKVGEQDMAVEARGRQQPQFGEHGWRHLLGLVDDQHRSRQSGVDVGLPAITQHLGSGPAVVRSQLDAEQIAHFAIEVGEAGLRARDDADPDVALRAEALGENAQRDGLAGAGGAGDEGEAAFADEQE